MSARGAVLCIQPHVFLPGCDLQNCPVTEYDLLLNEHEWNAPPIIPSSIFHDMVLVLDFKNSRLIVHEDKLSAKRLASPYPRNGIGKPHWIPVVRSNHADLPYPVIRGAINNISVNFVLDSASPGSLWVCNSRLFTKFKNVNRVSPTALFKSLSGDKRTIGDWQIGNIKGRAPVIFSAKSDIDTEATGIDASVGNAILRDFLITIDYPNNRVCFERYL